MNIFDEWSFDRLKTINDFVPVGIVLLVLGVWFLIFRYLYRKKSEKNINLMKDKKTEKDNTH